MEIPKDDVVVDELDVYVSSDLQLSGTILSLMSQPLRPSWRPYDLDKITKMQYKPNAKRLEAEIPLDTEASTYNQHAKEKRKIKSMTLRSNTTSTDVNYAIGMIRDRNLILAPLDQCMQLRPSMRFVNAEAKQDEKQEEAEEEDAIAGTDCSY